MTYLGVIKGLGRAVYLILRSFGRTISTQIRWSGVNIGYNTAVSKDCCLEGENVIGQNCVISQSSFGRATYCANNVFISNSEVGAYSSIASNVSIGVHSHPTRGYISTFPGFHFRWPATPYLDRPKEFKVQMRTKIGNDVWIGDSAIILNGVYVGDGAIIGAGAIVTRDVPPYSVVGGIPARIIRYRFSESHITRLLKIRWWEWNSTEIARRQSLFADVDRFFKEINDE